jgi:hypothetical protein
MFNTVVNCPWCNSQIQLGALDYAGIRSAFMVTCCKCGEPSVFTRKQRLLLAIAAIAWLLLVFFLIRNTLVAFAVAVLSTSPLLAFLARSRISLVPLEMPLVSKHMENVVSVLAVVVLLYLFVQTLGASSPFG